MTRHDMLNEHLNVIHIIEQLNFSKLKSKSKEMTAAALSGDILQFNRIMDTMPDFSLDQLKSLARKKFGADYKKNEKYVDIKMKKTPDKIKDAMTVVRTSLMRIKSESKDPDIQTKVNEKVEELDELLKKVALKVSAGGVTFIALAWIIQFLFGMGPSIIPQLAIGGSVFLLVALIIYIIAFFVKIFIKAKKEGKKVTV